MIKSMIVIASQFPMHEILKLQFWKIYKNLSFIKIIINYVSVVMILHVLRSDWLMLYILSANKCFLANFPSKMSWDLLGDYNHRLANFSAYGFLCKCFKKIRTNSKFHNLLFFIPFWWNFHYSLGKITIFSVYLSQFGNSLELPFNSFWTFLAHLVSFFLPLLYTF